MTPMPASLTSRIHRILRYLGPARSHRGPTSTSTVDDTCTMTGTRKLVLVDFQNIPTWLDTMNKVDGCGARRYLRTGAVMVVLCEPGVWRRRQRWLSLPWVKQASRRGRCAALRVAGGDEAGDLAICTATSMASLLDDYQHVYLVSDDLQLARRLRLLHSDAFLTLLHPSGCKADNKEMSVVAGMHEKAAEELLHLLATM